MDAHVCIGIQARSTSTRFPNKISEYVGDKRVIEHVISACNGAAQYLERYKFSNRLRCSVFVLIPKGDPIKNLIPPEMVIEGDENDVLSRYMLMANKSQATYVVRITGDCPLLPPFLIYKCIISATKNHFDYFSNVGEYAGESMRTSIDGHDVEVISLRALRWADANSTTPEQREHVTVVLRNENPAEYFNRGILIGHNDHSEIKLSIDTQEDLMRVRDEYEKIQKKISLAKKRYGKSAVHRF